MFPPAALPSQYTLHPSMYLVGYQLRGRKRIPVFVRSEQEFVQVMNREAMAVIAVSLHGTPYSLPGLALMQSTGEITYATSEALESDPAVLGVLKTASQVRQQSYLATWDALEWWDAIHAFQGHPESRPWAINLLDDPVFCLRTYFEEYDIILASLNDACGYFERQLSANDVLSELHSIRALLIQATADCNAHKAG